MNANLNPDRSEFKAVVSKMEQLEQLEQNNCLHFQIAYDMLYLKGELELEPPLTNGELYTLTSKTLQASRYISGCCYLHAERLEAIRVLLEFGTEAPRRIEGVPAMDADKMRSFLQTCDMDVFTTLVDCVSEENERFYGTDNIDLQSPRYADDLSALQTALTSALEKKPALSAQISNAVHRANVQPSSPAPTQNMER